MTQSSETFVVTVWDKQEDEPYMIAKYGDLELARYVARNLKKHYIDDWGTHAEQYYEIRLQKREED